MAATRTGDTERLLAIAAAVAQSPGLSMAGLQDALEADTGKRWATSTLYGDLATLRAARVLAPGPNRHGYFLVGPTFSADEAKGLLAGLRLLAEDLRSPIARELHGRVATRMGLTVKNARAIAYPVEAVGNRVVLETTDDEYRKLVRALDPYIRQGREIRICKIFRPWEDAPHRQVEHVVIPLQLLFHDVAWYLLAEESSDRQFRVFRLDRLRPDVSPTGTPARGIARQLDALAEARRLMGLGWGVMIPPRGTRADSDDLVRVKVRFDAHAARFIQESVRRHPTQSQRMAGDELVFGLRLHPCALGELERWLCGWGEHALVVEPEELRARLTRRLEEAAARYRHG